VRGGDIAEQGEEIRRVSEGIGRYEKIIEIQSNCDVKAKPPVTSVTRGF